MNQRLRCSDEPWVKIRHDVALRLLLQRVVADRGRGLQRRLDVAGLDEAAFCCSAWLAQTPAKQSACSSTCTCRWLASRLAPAALLRLLHLGQDAEQVLHVMADLVRDHIGLRELAGLAASQPRKRLSRSRKNEVSR